MGDRYILTTICPECDTKDNDVYYAPTCDFVTHRCSGCGFEIDLEEYAGISYEDASNLQEIEQIISIQKREGNVNDYQKRKEGCLYEELKHVYPDLALPDERTPEEKKRDAEQDKIDLFGPEEEKEKKHAHQRTD